jgi:hypothetical protein
MDEHETDEDGRFELSGKETELTSIDPKLNVYHDCKIYTSLSSAIRF